MRIATMAVLMLMIVSPAATVFPRAPQATDVPREIESARHALQGARNDLEHAGGHWGGHRVNAMKHIDEAVQELNEAEKWAREHHETK